MMRALAGSGDTWYVYDHEFAFVEVCVLLAMIPIVNVFDMVWHTISHRVERTSFVYGAKKRVEDDEDSHGHDPHEEHKQLGVILLSRMGTEFMTLGFLALLVFTSEYNGLFDELVDILPTGCSDGGSYYRRLAEESDCLHLPKSGLDWFHMFEIVHFSLFGGMCLYFVLMFGFVHGCVRQIRTWESIRYIDMETTMERRRMGDDLSLLKQAPSMWGLLPVDHEYRCMQSKFVDNLILMHEKDEHFNKQLLERCGICVGDPGYYDKLEEELQEASFDFSAYLSLQLEEAVSDSIEIHSVSWLFVWIYLLISFCFHLFAHVSLPTVALFVILPPSLVWFAWCFWVFRSQQVAIAKRRFHRAHNTPKSVRDLEAMASDRTKDSANVCFQGRRLLRVAQIVSIICSYVLARLIFAPPDWQINFLATLNATAAMGVVWVLMMLWLTFHSPVFLALLSLPPYFSLSNAKAMKNFWKAFKPEHALKLKPLERRLETARKATKSMWVPLPDDSSNTISC